VSRRDKALLQGSRFEVVVRLVQNQNKALDRNLLSKKKGVDNEDAGVSS